MECGKGQSQSWEVGTSKGPEGRKNITPRPALPADSFGTQNARTNGERIRYAQRKQGTLRVSEGPVT